MKVRFADDPDGIYGKLAYEQPEDKILGKRLSSQISGK
jgi:hypothetical protein